MADQMTITEIAPDGTTAVIEITEATADSTLIEDVIEALSGDDATLDDTDDTEAVAIEAVAEDAQTENFAPIDEIFIADAAEDDSVSMAFADAPGVMTVDEAYASLNDNRETGGIGMTVDEAYASIAAGNQTGSVGEAYADLTQVTAQTESAAQNIPAYAALSDDAADETAPTEAQLHAQAAADAQTAADDFVARGDYAAAAEARETAENEAFEANDQYILHGSDAIDLTAAAADQAKAVEYERQEAEYAQAGDYEAAHEAAGNAAEAIGNADWNAGGDDHAAQAEAEEFQTGYAAWEQSNADYYAQNAESFAADGNFEAAADYAGSAGEHQAAADWHGDLGTHDGASAVYNAASEVDSGGSYEAAPVDHSSYNGNDTTE